MNQIRIQALRRVICLCADCYTATHYGLAEVNGKDGEALSHLCAINGLHADEAERQIKSAFDLWRERSRSNGN